MTSGQWIAFAALCIPSLVGLGWLFFRTWDRFFDALLFVLTPDIISLFRGQMSKDWWASFIFGFYVVACLVTAALEKALVETIWVWGGGAG
jgi:hypothetical protein